MKQVQTDRKEIVDVIINVLQVLTLRGGQRRLEAKISRQDGNTALSQSSEETDLGTEKREFHRLKQMLSETINQGLGKKRQKINHSEVVSVEEVSEMTDDVNNGTFTSQHHAQYRPFNRKLDFYDIGEPLDDMPLNEDFGNSLLCVPPLPIKPTREIWPHA